MIKGIKMLKNIGFSALLLSTFIHPVHALEIAQTPEEIAALQQEQVKTVDRNELMRLVALLNNDEFREQNPELYLRVASIVKALIARLNLQRTETEEDQLTV